MSDQVKIGIFGAGAIGSAVYHLLKDRTNYSVTVADMTPYNATRSGAFAEEDYKQIDTRHPGANNSILQDFVCDFTLIINALPYTENMVIHNACMECNIPYFDFSEDAELDNWIRDRKYVSETRTGIQFTMPHCGLAPGMSTVIANNLMHDMDPVDHIKIRVGALSQDATNKLKYHLSWSADGLVNEYCGDCAIIRDGKYYEVPTLTGYETLMIGGDTYEAFNTSGGLGTFARTIADLDDERFTHSNINYKTIRRKGHHNLIDFLINDLRIPNKELIEIIKRGVSTTRRDVVILFITAGGRINGKHKERIYKKVFYPETYNDRYYTAIELTTASGMLTMVELFLQGKLKKEGYYKQEDVNLSDAVNTKFGSMFVMNR